MKTKYIVYTLIILFFSGFVAYRINANKQKANAGRTAGGRGGQAGAVQVNGVVIKTQSFSNSLSATGSIEASEQIEIRPEVSGVISGLYFKEGSQVNKGQVLLKINDVELQAQLSQALTREKLAIETERRAEQLLQKEAISKEEYDIALADRKSLEAATQLIRAQISKTRVIAPFSGKIGLRTISEGGYVTPATVIANLISINPVKILFSVPEKYAQQMTTGTEIQFSMPGTSSKNTARIYAIEPGINPGTRTLQIAATAANPKGEFLPGSFSRIEMPLSVINDAILIPTEAVIPIEAGKKVFISKNGKATEVLIETTTRTDKDLLVTSGLEVGDTLLTTGIMALKPLSPVKVKITAN